MLFKYNIVLILIVYLPIKSLAQIGFELIRTPRRIKMGNRSGELINCEGLDCLTLATTGVTRVPLVIYQVFTHYLNTMYLVTEVEGHQTVKTRWRYELDESCSNAKSADKRSHDCRNLYNIVVFTSTEPVTLIRLFGYATYYENYVGCYRINPVIANVTFVTDITACMNECSGSYKWIGLAGSSDDGVYCMCLTSLEFGIAAVNISHCDCRYGIENYDILCGGSEEEFVSVYSTREVPIWQEGEYTEKCMAYRENCRSCKPGRVGDMCQMHDCNVAGSCGDLVCFDVALKSPIVVSSCSCPTGYYMNENLTCNEADECLMQPCTAKISSCLNNVGSFECECFNGYKRITHTSCEDINECVELEEPCKLINSTCHNLPGNYTCLCSPGYKIINETCTWVEVEAASNFLMWLFIALGALLLVFLLSTVLILLRSRRSDASEE